MLYMFRFKVTENTHRYLKEIEMREEAGTPAIVGAIRAGLVFQLKQVPSNYLIIMENSLITTSQILLFLKKYLI